MPERWARVVVAWVAGLLWFLPVAWIVITALSPSEELLGRGLSSVIPTSLTLENFNFVLDRTNYSTYFQNSLLVAAATVILTVLLSCTGGYALARLPFPGQGLLGHGTLLAYTVPKALLVVPIFTIFVGLQLANSKTGLTITYLTFTLPFAIWLMKGFYEGLPAELEEAALIDGASRFRAFRSVILPLAVPGIAAVAVFSFLLAWNDYLFALVFLIEEESRTLPVGVSASLHVNTMSADLWSALMAASVMSAIPVFIVFLAAQRFLVQGMAAGSVKG